MVTQDMHLSKVAIRNFRNIEDLVVNLKSGLNVIVGVNNVGKTNFACSIQIALGQQPLSETDVPIRPDGTRSTEPIQIDLVFAGLSADERAQYLDILDLNPEKPEESTASIHFEASWTSENRRPRWTRWAGERKRTEAAVPEDVLESLRVTLLTALRDATSELLPGRQSRLGRLLRLLATDPEREEITNVIQSANSSLREKNLVIKTRERIQERLTGASGEKFAQQVQIGTSAPRFDFIVNSLRIVLQNIGVGSLPPVELGTNGLGYNNLIYMATVLSELAATEPTDSPLLIVEEPEAHLHPQLQCILSSFLSKPAHDIRQVQTILTTHSPTIAAHVPPESIHVFHRDETGALVSTRIDECGLTERELKELRRLLDVTKATLLFANGVILVEGISEALLLPVLAERERKPLERNGISVVPVYGVDFSTLMKLFGQGRLRIKAAVLTDGDPGEIQQEDRIIPATDANGQFKRAARIGNLIDKKNDFIDVFVSDVTLEYDLAAAGPVNPEVMVEAWEECYQRRSKLLTAASLADAGSDPTERARVIWRGTCLSNSTVSKPEFAQRLAAKLQREEDYAMVRFDTPEYIKRAIDFVLGNVADSNAG
jgi:putative ATP-dependent endonuclease of the OLD family